MVGWLVVASSVQLVADICVLCAVCVVQAAGHFGSLHEAAYAACLEGDSVALQKMCVGNNSDLLRARPPVSKGFPCVRKLTPPFGLGGG